MDYIRNDYETILERKEAQQEGSYTCYLFEKGLYKILKKARVIARVASRTRLYNLN